MDIKQLKDNIRSFSLEDGDLGSQGYTQVLLQLFGCTGHGKSSFINSCMYVLEDPENFTEYAEARESPEGWTMRRNDYPLTELITIVDNRGCSKLKEFERAEVFAQLGNFIPIGQEVVWRDNYKSVMKDLENSELEPNITDFIVPIFVYKAEQQIQNKDMKEVKTFLDNCMDMTGLFPIIVLTFKKNADYLEIEKLFRQIGAETVIAIENYTQKSHIKTLERTTDILRVIDSALRNVKYRLEQPRNPRKERIERKKLMYNYIHQIHLHQEREKIESEKERDRKGEVENKSGKWCQIL